MLIALVVLGIVCAGLALACVWLSGRQRDQQAQAAELAKQLAVFEQRLKEQASASSRTSRSISAWAKSCAS